MKNQSVYFIVCLILIAHWSCTPVKIYSDPGMTRETGLKYFTVKPFLQVERDPESKRIIKSVVLYLPDLANPQYMAIKKGPGSSKVDLKLADGSISTFGFTSDAKTEEYMEALASVLSKGAGAIEDLSSLKSPQLSASTSNSVELYEIVITDTETILREVKFDEQ